MLNASVMQWRVLYSFYCGRVFATGKLEKSPAFVLCESFQTCLFQLKSPFLEPNPSRLSNLRKLAVNCDKTTSLTELSTLPPGDFLILFIALCNINNIEHPKLTLDDKLETK